MKEIVFVCIINEQIKNMDALINGFNKFKKDLVAVACK